MRKVVGEAVADGFQQHEVGRSFIVRKVVGEAVADGFRGGAQEGVVGEAVADGLYEGRRSRP